MKNKLTGLGIAIVTPFKKDLSVDHESLSKIVNYNIENGTNYIVISGTTGESVTVSKIEKKEIIATIVKANNNRVPLVLGIGGNNTAEIIEEINTTNFKDISAILSVSPAYSKPTQEGIYQHFKAVSSASPVPVILYNVPGRTASNMLTETVIRLATDFENIVAIKEAAGSMFQYFQLIKNKPKDFLVISGDDDLALPVTLAGGAGVISVIGQAFPEKFSKMIHLALEGKAKEAFKLHYQFLDIISLIFAENNPAGIKAVLEKINLCKDVVRLPLVAATDSLKTKIADFVNNF
ncbi:4-hydroxy-tetrahydrodipicolinate synthase [Xanthomarina sp. F2636L]|uniref:4-hydroxy-tetrahydrodipicolinate synthase n=1 Tax=Xanthomarina sp. F2636L TaxID=2996018 RepID=UPI00225E602D|nr:4-hydroxy-tetrahydrodipicolinate synthase [Xanthomarina sp. F2636L]MCX7552194.1 4-hydroxy-tetrahydrodipicolinate synthase [Xanthomarina sp. F2636L]